MRCSVCGGLFDAEVAELVRATGSLFGCRQCGAIFNPYAAESENQEALARNGVLVYKYRPPDDRSVRIVRDRKLYCSRPGHLNDPLDCQFDLAAEVSRAFARLESRVGKQKKRQQRLMALHRFMFEPMSQIGKNFIECHEIENLEAGILCFSARPDIPSLWAHYAADHSGFCLGFDPYALVQDPPPEAEGRDFGYGAIAMAGVRYDVDYPFDSAIAQYIWNDDIYPSDEPDLNEVIAAAYRSIFDSLFIKTSHWAYEEEIRLTWATKFGPFPFKSTSLKSVVYGLRVDPTTKANIQGILRQSEWSHVRQQQVVKSNRSIGLELVDCE